MKKEELAWEIFNSLDYHLRERLSQADSIVRTMITDMILHGIPTKDAEAFMQERLHDTLEIIRVQAETKIRSKRTYTPHYLKGRGA